MIRSSLAFDSEPGLVEPKPAAPAPKLGARIVDVKLQAHTALVDHDHPNHPAIVVEKGTVVRVFVSPFDDRTYYTSFVFVGDVLYSATKMKNDAGSISDDGRPEVVHRKIRAMVKG